MTVTTDNYSFDFPQAVDAFKFDEKDKLSPFNLDTQLKSYCRKELARFIPVGKANKRRWHKSILDKTSLFVVDAADWNRNLTRWGTCAYLGE